MSYGLVSPFSLAQSWLADETMVMAARSGVSIGASVYGELDARMVRAPGNVMVAYEQALYFLALAARRAMREGQSDAADFLLNALDRTMAEGDAVEAEVNWFCRTLGVACPSGGSVQVLQEAIDAIQGSGLNLDDSTQLASILRSNKWALQIKQALPLIAATGIGVVVGTWWYRRKNP